MLEAFENGQLSSQFTIMYFIEKPKAIETKKPPVKQITAKPKAKIKSKASVKKTTKKK